MQKTNKSHLTTLHIDWPMFYGILILCAIGLAILYSSHKQLDLVQKQLLRLGVACILMFVVAQINPRLFRAAAVWLYAFTIILLILVLIKGAIAKGGQRWIYLAGIRFQPAEIMKLALPMMLARYFHERLLPPKLVHLVVPFLLTITPCLLIAKQPDLGTATLVFATGSFIIFFAGISWRAIASSIAAAAALCPILWMFMYEYQRKRVLTLLNPESNHLTAGYQIIQSKIALGSGGVYGKGWLNVTQSTLEYLPERSTDFIFGVFGEEFGLFGCILLLCAYLYVILRGLYIAMHAKDTFSRLLAGSLTMTVFVYVFINIGMVSGILPVVGIPLPLISYGGTALVTLMISFGMLMSIQTHRTLLSR